MVVVKRQQPNLDHLADQAIKITTILIAADRTQVLDLIPAAAEDLAAYEPAAAVHDAIVADWRSA